MDVKIVNFTETSIATLEHCGPIGHLNETVRVFIDWRRETGLSPVQTSRTFGIPYGNPDTIPPEEFRFDACGEVAALVPDNAQGVRNKIIPAGRCAGTLALLIEFRKQFASDVILVKLVKRVLVCPQQLLVRLENRL